MTSKEKMEQLEPQEEEAEVQKNISITQLLLTKTYGEPPWNRNWPETVDDGGYVIVGSDTKYNYKTREQVALEPTHTWCYWGWDAGRPVRFASPVDAEVFIKTLSVQDEKGRPYGRGKVASIIDTGENERLKNNDDALPVSEYEEDYDDEE